MNFEKAYKELLNGKKIRRKEWEHLMHLRMVDSKNIRAYKGEVTTFYNNPNFLISDNWKVVDGDDTEMTFLEAIEVLKQKKCITREDLQEGFIFIDNDNLAYCRPVEYDFMPTFKCLCASDWEIMK